MCKPPDSSITRRDRTFVARELAPARLCSSRIFGAATQPSGSKPPRHSKPCSYETLIRKTIGDTLHGFGFIRCTHLCRRHARAGLLRHAQGQDPRRLPRGRS
ncbi:hypothetical protein C1X96_14655 [Pseudomonas sp. FW300-N1A5]|nr:hypothetical protein C1X96_14655 [Pseudomonas sp. FW300-N1A5]